MGEKDGLLDQKTTLHERVLHINLPYFVEIWQASGLDGEVTTVGELGDRAQAVGFAILRQYLMDPDEFSLGSQTDQIPDEQSSKVFFFSESSQKYTKKVGLLASGRKNPIRTLANLYDELFMEKLAGILEPNLSDNDYDIFIQELHNYYEDYLSSDDLTKVGGYDSYLRQNIGTIKMDSSILGLKIDSVLPRFTKMPKDIYRFLSGIGGGSQDLNALDGLTLFGEDDYTQTFTPVQFKQGKLTQFQGPSGHSFNRLFLVVGGDTMFLSDSYTGQGDQINLKGGDSATFSGTGRQLTRSDISSVEFISFEDLGINSGKK
jgi:hypothetical protein